MPYIKSENREVIDLLVDDLVWQIKGKGKEKVAGNLNYTISKLLDQILDLTPRYNDINTLVGVLECAKLEFYRRVAAPYEDIKKEENGDVYT